MKTVSKSLLIVFLATLFGTVQGTAQITIAPTTLYLDDQNRFGTMLVLNGSSQPQEVSIEFEFGYLAADSAGNPEMVYDDSLAASEKSVADRILGFPSNFTLQPNQRQVVRLTVRNTGSLADGTYWSRIRTISNPVSPSIEEQTSEGISAQINFRFEQVTTAFFKKGNVTTGLDFGESNVSITDNTGIIHTRMSQTGNSPYIGTMNLRILNEQGDLVTESSSTVAIYFTTQRQFQFDASEMPPGTYTAEMVFETTRTSIDDAEMVQASPINHTVTFRMQ